MERKKKAECKAVALCVREKVGNKTYEIDREGVCGCVVCVVCVVGERKKERKGRSSLGGYAASFIDGKDTLKTKDKNKRPR